MTEFDSSQVFIDDQDTSITYSGTWQKESQIDNVLKGTLSKATSPGATASYTFNGTALGTFVNVFGSQFPGNQPLSTYSVDDSSPSQFQGSGITKEEDSQQFFSSSIFNGGTHTLVITVTNCSQESPFYLDFLEVISEIPGSSSGSMSATSSSSSVPTAQAVVASHGSSTPVGAIIGGVVGGVAVLVVAAVAVFFFCFRRRNRRPYFYGHAPVGELLGFEGKEVTPYPQPPNSPPPASETGIMPYKPFIPPSASSHTTSPPASETGGSTYVASSSAGGGPSNSSGYVVRNVDHSSPNQPLSKAAQAGLLSAPPSTTFYADSGIRFDQVGEPSASQAGPFAHRLVGEALTDVPPSYSED
ncbi:hypothetical protein CERSUDRAFT_91715 [Gelatoporia subvermispora B]|uniref:Mid2 domain-containing protein n=1 Tax=Ceriporiopsis subvermispora (strain B) TaxID=914234 RepID=M2RR95_CERS8|nr:hypothetical protein CERSUDRAFT_91715 [Gelatoporia subvermispora B]